MAELIDVLAQHRFDEAALSAYLQLPAPLIIRQFQGGQSNPTYQITDASGRRYVLRKKPPGAILPSAHAIEREYAVMHALRVTDVPVPAMRLLCEDPGVIGTPFYLMDYIDGRILIDLKLPELSAAERTATYLAMADGLAALHRVDWRGVGLGDFGKPENYVARQISRWTRQYLASNPEPNPDMEALIAWLPENVPPEDAPTIAHGDYRLGNLMFAPDRPELLAILDWELSTIGQPLSDLAYMCNLYHLPYEGAPFRGLGGQDLAGTGIPTEGELIARYCEQVGRSCPPPALRTYQAFNLFRSAAIGQGVYDRSQRGNAADARAHLFATMVRTCAHVGWQIAQGK